MMIYTFDSDTVSDLHKDAHGFRPSRQWWAAWNGMDDRGRQEEWDRLINEAEAEAANERERENRARTRWQAHIIQLMADNGISQDTALRWDMQAMGANGDAGYYCYLWGIGHTNEEEIVRIINPVCMAA